VSVPPKKIDQRVVLIVENEFFVRCARADCAREAGLGVIEAASAKQAMAACHVETPPGTRNEGKLDKAKGSARKFAGDVKDAVKDADD
jgi:hypothetical protein